MASLPSRVVASFDTIKPVPNLTGLDGEFNALVGGSGILNGNTTGTKLLVKTSDATDPPITVDQVGAGAILIGKQNGSTKFTVENDGDLLSNGITTAAGVVTFGSIPVGPASDPTTSNQLTRKAYTDALRTRWSINWLVYDPSTFPASSVDQVAIVKVPGAFVATHIGYLFCAGTASGSFTITIQKRNSAFAGGSQVGIGALVVNSGTLNTPVESDVTNVPFTAGDYVYFTIDSPSSPAQRSVSFFVRGYKIPETGE